jgi:glutamine synthetase
VVGSVFEMSPQRRQALNVRLLPRSLGEAINLAEGSELLLETLGDHTFNSLIRNKEIEWEEYRSTVIDYEISRYLPIF